MTFSTLPCTCRALMSVPHSDSPAYNCSSLPRLPFISKAANSKLFSSQTCPDWLERRSQSQPATSAAKQGTWHTQERQQCVLCAPFPEHHLLQQFHLSLLCCCLVPPGWASLGLAGVISDLMATGPPYRPWQRDTCHSTLLYWGMPSKSGRRSGRINLLLHLGSMSILAGFTHSSNPCHNKSDIYKTPHICTNLQKENCNSAHSLKKYPVQLQLFLKIPA